MEIVVNFFNHGFHGLTRIVKQKKHGVYSLREWSGIFANPHARDLADVFSKTPPSRQAGRAPCFFWTPILGNFFTSRNARKAGPLAERVGDSETGEPESLLAREPGSEAPAQVTWTSPCVLLLSVSIREIRGSKFTFPCKLPCEGN